MFNRVLKAYKAVQFKARFEDRVDGTQCSTVDESCGLETMPFCPRLGLPLTIFDDQVTL